ncbi:acyl-CoA dehydrogenase [Amorphus orientalis]|uniref:3-methylmercaptopropionyl-CoA dehydrogenase n=1 Tax=Amorphus orientalis TaxID=649198 RepID=A0AAE4ASV3_9HYPH|nr:acyl-CoA dehydrogenase [Amorphus orientalis]MDQ0314369.1 alkylation response protein AidB-like acyl-CoA dehydrogenase [Amorphus orientalis]
MAYRAPVDEIAFTLKTVAGLDGVLSEGLFPDLSEDLVDAILEEAGRFATEALAPLNAEGDRAGSRFSDGRVETPRGWADAYRQWLDGGWSTLSGPTAFGGQDLPQALQAATVDLWNEACPSFAIAPILSSGAIEAIDAHASDGLKQLYLENLVTGKWTGTMNLTEPQAGSDLAALRTRAERAEDGTYRIFGQKIYITYGEHDLTDNIVHLVLARLPDAPAGTRGISLFLVPKFLVNEDGSLGARNDVTCRGIEHKLGLHASPTCTMGYGDDGEGAVGYLIGEENRGLACMFTMMNNARLNVGLQGVGVAERALQAAADYAAERTQGRSPDYAGEGMSPIVYHPDVKRMLLSMRALTGAARSIAYACAVAIDRAERMSGEDARFWKARADLLTPIAKAFSTDVGVEVASLGIQVHGGMGYVEETGAAQYLRDARIFPIYEGTNGIQAIDLVMRKLPMGDGAAMASWIADLRRDADRVRGANRPEFTGIGDRLLQAIGHLEDCSAWLAEARSGGREAEALAGATPFLTLAGLTGGACGLAVGAVASAGEDADRDSMTARRRALVAQVFAETHLSRTESLAREIMGGSAAISAAPVELLAS